MSRQDRERQQPDQNRVPVQDARVRAVWVKIRPQRLEEGPIPIQGHTTNDIAKCGPIEDGEESASKKEHSIPEGDPHRILDVRAEFDGDPTQHQEPENDDQWQVEPAEAGGIEHREGEEHSTSGCNEPDFVSVPHRANGL